MQQSVTDPGCGYVFIANVGDAQSTGAEVEIAWKPVEPLVLSASGSYLHAEFKSIASPLQDAAAVGAGDPIPDVPRAKSISASSTPTPPSGTMSVTWASTAAM